MLSSLRHTTALARSSAGRLARTGGAVAAAVASAPRLSAVAAARHYRASSKPLQATRAAASSASGSATGAPAKQVPGMLTLTELKAKVASGEVESIIMGFPDMYGRMLGKRFDADFFLQSAAEDGTHACDYLLACDMEMVPIPGFAYANWERGFGDFHMVVDWNSLRHVSWQERTAMVLCDIHDNKTHELVSVAPRSVLRKQIDAANAMGYPTIYSATELEYYQYEASYREAHARNYQQKLLRPSGDYMEDYHILQTSREEKYTSVFRRHLKASGIPTENSKGECGIGQHELNVRYADILPMADRHLVYKARELAEVPKTLGAAVSLFEGSTLAQQALGKEVVEHYAHFYRTEQQAYDKQVSDWERTRYFERI